MVKRVFVSVVMVLMLGLGIPALGGEVTLLKSVDDLLAMTDAEAITFAIKAAPTLDFLNGARFYRYTRDGGLRLLKGGDGPWNFVA